MMLSQRGLDVSLSPSPFLLKSIQVLFVCFKEQRRAGSRTRRWGLCLWTGQEAAVLPGEAPRTSPPSVHSQALFRAWVVWAVAVKPGWNDEGAGPVPEGSSLQARHPDSLGGHTDSPRSGRGRPQGTGPQAPSSQNTAAGQGSLFCSVCARTHMCVCEHACCSAHMCTCCVNMCVCVCACRCVDTRAAMHTRVSGVQTYICACAHCGCVDCA